MGMELVLVLVNTCLIWLTWGCFRFAQGLVIVIFLGGFCVWIRLPLGLFVGIDWFGRRVMFGFMIWV